VTPDDFMHATQVARPFHTKGWVYEEKYDGWRMLALKDNGEGPAGQPE
jgi:ATP-dependent DNA ligase